MVRTLCSLILFIKPCVPESLARAQQNNIVVKINKMIYFQKITAVGNSQYFSMNYYYALNKQQASHMIYLLQSMDTAFVNYANSEI